MITNWIVSSLVLVSFAPQVSLAQELDLRSDDAEIETLYDRMDEEATSAPKESAPTSSKRAEDQSADNLTDLARLQTFQDIAVIQRRFLPKTNRLEISGVGFSNLNNPFFNNLGFGLKLAYHFTEAWGVEGVGNWYGVAARQVTKDLEKAGVSTANVVTAKGFMGGAIRWSPIYGKISLLNKSIVPFDLGFSGGFGMTRTAESSGEPTVYLGTNQIFAISKSIAFRWDLMWNLYQASVTDGNGVKSEVSHNDLFLGVGVSWYIPGAGYR